MTEVDNCVLPTAMALEAGLEFEDFPAEPTPSRDDRPRHRLAEVRRREGVSRRTVAERMGMDIKTVAREEKPTSDPTLSTLYRWHETLGVPISELLYEPPDALSPPILKRAQMLRIMKHAKGILKRGRKKVVLRKARKIVEEVLDIMPELKDLRAGHVAEPADPIEKFGRLIEQPLPEKMFDPPEIRA